jgi:HAD superfamily hydrolase (TIGR01459 family)
MTPRFLLPLDPIFSSSYPMAMDVSLPTIPLVDGIKDLGARYRAWLVDVWGVMHNGERSFPQAVAATRAFRAAGGIVVLLSNSPRPSPAVQVQLGEFGVPDDAYDATVTSGDLTRHELAKHPGAPVFHLGPLRDRSIFQGLDVVLAEPSEAELVVCSGLFDDETETPGDYRQLLHDLAARKLPMICANPDHLVERGDRLIWCAGALAAIYADERGSVVYAGKPHPPIYALAHDTVSNLAERRVGKDEILAIGDGIETDIAGASAFGIDSIFVASGLHVPKSGEDAGRAYEHDLAGLFARTESRPRAVMQALVW